MQQPPQGSPAIIPWFHSGQALTDVEAWPPIRLALPAPHSDDRVAAMPK